MRSKTKKLQRTRQGIYIDYYKINEKKDMKTGTKKTKTVFDTKRGNFTRI